MSEHTPERLVTKPSKAARKHLSVNMWGETVKLLDRLIRRNTRTIARLHRNSRAAELHHLVVEEATRQQIIEAD